MTQAVASHNDRSNRSRLLVGVAALMALGAASLGVASGLHLSGLVHGRSPSFDPDAAGIAEAVIGVVLALGALAMVKSPRRARAVGIGATSFALVGFLIGIGETASGGDIGDIAYHATMIPLLVAGLVLLVRSRSDPQKPTNSPLVSSRQGIVRGVGQPDGSELAPTAEALAHDLCDAVVLTARTDHSRSRPKGLA